jgi:hypothetical protein
VGHAEEVRRTFCHAYLRALWRYVAVTPAAPAEDEAVDAVHAELLATAAVVVRQRHGIHLHVHELDGLGGVLHQVTAGRLRERAGLSWDRGAAGVKGATLGYRRDHPTP